MVMTKVFGRLPTRFLYQKTHETPPYLEFKPEKEVIPYPLIFLHGILGSKQNWRSICHRLARDHHFKCYSIDTRHHGEWKCSETFNYFKMAEDVKNFLDFHNIPKVNLVGHSMGGKTAMTFSQLYPDVLSTLTVVDIAPIRVRQFSMLNAYLEAMFSIDLANKSKDDVRNIMLDKLKVNLIRN
ncbi:Abhydrolase domain-containing protein [Thelohanellus kitauei]|uniref:sn-1-specific diacylglycerol lipase ABHD11 n=1 Tax=Thelohanellus kitauei TaxID=669202 RepID=A0A0C2IUX6_THEKT|nr:Abhydrolase domain-containing protein [Thelohanellus kitauei]